MAERSIGWRHGIRLLALSAILLAAGQAGWADNWPRFRGRDGSGVAPEQGIPTSWKVGDFAWVVELPGEGHGQPVIWDQHLFVTTATDDGLVRSLICLHAETGELRWSRSMGFNTHKKHKKNSYASTTPATDGERVYVTFADNERYCLAAYDFSGELLWRVWLGPFVSQHGVGASPVVFEDLVIVANDQDGPSSIVAYDRRDGRLVWSTLRDFREASYATPLIIEPAGSKPQLIVLSGATGLNSLDPWTGAVNWRSEPLPKRTVASPAYACGLVLATCGQGGKGDLLIGVDPLKVDANGIAPIQFQRERTLPYVPTIIGYDDHLYLWNDNGIVMCVDPKTDRTIWQERVGGNYSGSPICIGGKLYCIEESGQVAVVDASPTFKFHGMSELGDPSHSTPSVANGRLYLRSFHKLACLTAPKSTAK
jgi:outer membrane protein assembly factor BamB